jgi:hypothetical protein
LLAPVVMKVLPPALATDLPLRARFVREARGDFVAQIRRTHARDDLFTPRLRPQTSFVRQCSHGF